MPRMKISAGEKKEDVRTFKTLEEAFRDVQTFESR
jgi:hypothetical protein